MEHGGDIYTEGILKGRKLIDFSSNINPLGVPESFTANIGEGLAGLDVYPDIKYRESKQYICNYINKSWAINCKEEDLVLGNGAGENIDIAIRSLESITIVSPAFIEYEDRAQKNGSKIAYSMLNKDMEVDYKDLLEKVKATQGLIIANPNNPNGGLIDREKFKPILKHCQKYNKKVIIDEAFIEFTGNKDDSLIDLVNSYSCICIIRALTKFYGIPGIRLGYSICKDKDYNGRMRDKQIPWNVNSFAQLALKYVLEDEEYIRVTKKWLEEERPAFIKEIGSLKMVDRVYPSKANFILVRLNKISGEKLYQDLIKENILIRRCNNYNGLGDEYVRLAIKAREDNEILIEKLERYDILDI
ncbi:MAG: aminotransferase class I/II-fold pyridoxal phosphate-dependent enzyme [Epulopiscium sp.]|nr:aminotransferase class I/II-fold pyridoxal phosphate-dependent enzyme [Candidatus Epulonipiscium sp.]